MEVLRIKQMAFVSGSTEVIRLIKFMLRSDVQLIFYLIFLLSQDSNLSI